MLSCGRGVLNQKVLGTEQILVKNDPQTAEKQELPQITSTPSHSQLEVSFSPQLPLTSVFPTSPFSLFCCFHFCLHKPSSPEHSLPPRLSSSSSLFHYPTTPSTVFYSSIRRDVSTSPLPLLTPSPSHALPFPLSVY